MLIYLDGMRSVARQPNENFARELLELFTLGEGHYSEADIKAAARAFTGWTVDRETGHFRTRDNEHDGGEKTFLGQTGRFDGDAIIAILLKHPRTAETIVEKLWREFVSLQARSRRGQEARRRRSARNYEIKPLMRAILLSAQFRDPANRGALIKSPVELVVGTVHLLGLPVPEKTQLVRMMQGLGQMPFDPPNVKGWPGGESWITTYTLLLRQQFLRRIVEATTVASMEGGDDVEPAQPAHRAPRAAADAVGRRHHADGRADGRAAAGRGPQPALCRRRGAARPDAVRRRLRDPAAHAAAARADRHGRCLAHAGRHGGGGDARHRLPAEVRSAMGRILLLVELKGGNDGLNTVIPYADPKYRELRPGIGVARDHTMPARREGRAAQQARAVDGVVEGGRPRDRAGRRLSLSQPLAFPLDRDLGHRLGLEPDA